MERQEDIDQVPPAQENLSSSNNIVPSTVSQQQSIDLSTISIQQLPQYYGQPFLVAQPQVVPIYNIAPAQPQPQPQPQPQQQPYFFPQQPYNNIIYSTATPYIISPSQPQQSMYQLATVTDQPLTMLGVHGVPIDQPSTMLGVHGVPIDQPSTMLGVHGVPIDQPSTMLGVHSVPIGQPSTMLGVHGVQVVPHEIPQQTEEEEIHAGNENDDEEIRVINTQTNKVCMNSGFDQHITTTAQMTPIQSDVEVVPINTTIITSTVTPTATITAPNIKDVIDTKAAQFLSDNRVQTIYYVKQLNLYTNELNYYKSLQYWEMRNEFEDEILYHLLGKLTDKNFCQFYKLRNLHLRCSSTENIQTNVEVVASTKQKKLQEYTNEVVEKFIHYRNTMLRKPTFEDFDDHAAVNVDVDLDSDYHIVINSKNLNRIDGFSDQCNIDTHVNIESTFYNTLHDELNDLILWKSVDRHEWIRKLEEMTQSLRNNVEKKVEELFWNTIEQRLPTRYSSLLRTQHQNGETLSLFTYDGVPCEQLLQLNAETLDICETMYHFLHHMCKKFLAFFDEIHLRQQQPQQLVYQPSSSSSSSTPSTPSTPSKPQQPQESQESQQPQQPQGSQQLQQPQHDDEDDDNQPMSKRIKLSLAPSKSSTSLQNHSVSRESLSILSFIHDQCSSTFLHPQTDTNTFLDRQDTSLMQKLPTYYLANRMAEYYENHDVRLEIRRAHIKRLNNMKTFQRLYNQLLSSSTPSSLNSIPFLPSSASQQSSPLLIMHSSMFDKINDNDANKEENKDDEVSFNLIAKEGSKTFTPIQIWKWWHNSNVGGNDADYLPSYPILWYEHNRKPQSSEKIPKNFLVFDCFAYLCPLCIDGDEEDAFDLYYCYKAGFDEHLGKHMDGEPKLCPEQWYCNVEEFVNGKTKIFTSTSVTTTTTPTLATSTTSNSTTTTPTNKIEHFGFDSRYTLLCHAALKHKKMINTKSIEQLYKRWSDLYISLYTMKPLISTYDIWQVSEFLHHTTTDTTPTTAITVDSCRHCRAAQRWRSIGLEFGQLKRKQTQKAKQQQQHSTTATFTSKPLMRWKMHKWLRINHNVDIDGQRELLLQQPIYRRLVFDRIRHETQQLVAKIKMMNQKKNEVKRSSALSPPSQEQPQLQPSSSPPPPPPPQRLTLRISPFIRRLIHIQHHRIYFRYRCTLCYEKRVQPLLEECEQLSTLTSDLKICKFVKKFEIYHLLQHSSVAFWHPELLRYHYSMYHTIDDLKHDTPPDKPVLQREMYVGRFEFDIVQQLMETLNDEGDTNQSNSDDNDEYSNIAGDNDDRKDAKILLEVLSRERKILTNEELCRFMLQYNGFGDDDSNSRGVKRKVGVELGKQSNDERSGRDSGCAHKSNDPYQWMMKPEQLDSFSPEKVVVVKSSKSSVVQQPSLPSSQSEEGPMDIDDDDNNIATNVQPQRNWASAPPFPQHQLPSDYLLGLGGEFVSNSDERLALLANEFDPISSSLSSSSLSSPSLDVSNLNYIQIQSLRKSLLYGVVPQYLEELQYLFSSETTADREGTVSLSKLLSQVQAAVPKPLSPQQRPEQSLSSCLLLQKSISELAQMNESQMSHWLQQISTAITTCETALKERHANKKSAEEHMRSDHNQLLLQYTNVYQESLQKLVGEQDSDSSSSSSSSTSSSSSSSSSLASIIQRGEQLRQRYQLTCSYSELTTELLNTYADQFETFNNNMGKSFMTLREQIRMLKENYSTGRAFYEYICYRKHYKMFHTRLSILLTSIRTKCNYKHGQLNMFARLMKEILDSAQTTNTTTSSSTSTLSTMLQDQYSELTQNLSSIETELNELQQSAMSLLKSIKIDDVANINATTTTTITNLIEQSFQIVLNLITNFEMFDRKLVQFENTLIEAETLGVLPSAMCHVSNANRSTMDQTASISIDSNATTTTTTTTDTTTITTTTTTTATTTSGGQDPGEQHNKFAKIEQKLKQLKLFEKQIESELQQQNVGHFFGGGGNSGGGNERQNVSVNQPQSPPLPLSQTITISPTTITLTTTTTTTTTTTITENYLDSNSQLRKMYNFVYYNNQFNDDYQSPIGDGGVVNQSNQTPEIIIVPSTSDTTDIPRKKLTTTIERVDDDVVEEQEVAELELNVEEQGDDVQIEEDIITSEIVDLEFD